MATILGLDLGTNSIGWALIEQDNHEAKGQVIAVGSRILPMSQDILGKFDSGVSISQTAERTNFRGIRRLRERHLLRRERLHRVLNILGFLPEHYANQIDFNNGLGQFIPEAEPKLPYSFNPHTQKTDFIFKRSFEEMMRDFELHQPRLVDNGKKIPYDWTIYYLRKKALTEKIEKEELAWLLLNFNQKRGYYQLRGEDDEENKKQLVEFYSFRIIGVQATNDRKDDEIWYNVFLDNGWIYKRKSKTPLDWIDKTKEFIVTTELNDDGTIKKDKDGKEKRSFRAPAETDWTLVKKKTEYEIDKSHKTVGTYIYDTLLEKPNQKIKGKLVRVIERKFYKAELEAILIKQNEFHEELRDSSLYQTCIEELYQHNDAHRNSIGEKGFAHLFLNDIIYYQRPLKSKRSLISNCKFETRTFIKDGKKEVEPIKCIAKSHPLFQEFRLWQFIQNLKIYKKDNVDIDVTLDFLKTEEDRVNCFEWLNEKKDIDQKAFLKYPAFNLKKGFDDYRWNYVEDKNYPCNETRYPIATRLKNVENVPTGFLNKENEEALWHILYSVEDKNDIVKALKTFTVKRGLGEDFVEQFKRFPPFKKEYGSYSAKAIKKLLPLMRIGKFWNEEDIIHNSQKYQTNIQKVKAILLADRDKKNEKPDNGFPSSFNSALLSKLEILADDLSEYKGLDHFLASYIAYGRHSEDNAVKKWKTADKIELLEQYSLRNPIVEQIINETLQIVKEIWKRHGNGNEGFFDQIHVELGREMKNPADARKRMTENINENENTNLRIKALLTELLNDSDIENVRPYSPMQQEILKIYEEGALNAEGDIPDDILKIAKQARPTSAELTRYKLWLQQKYRSPYTGDVIPLSRLFTRAYDIEHIIPQSRYFDNSFSNKVICEMEVNKDKDNLTAFEYIKENRGKKVQLSNGKVTTLLTIEQYEEFVKNHYSKTRGKMKKLLMDEIPTAFIERQMNDTRYISKVVKNLMSNILREEGEDDTISKKIIVTNGNITSALKQDWGLNDIWNDLISPRFERMNALTKSSNFGEWTNKEGKKVFQTQVPLELSKGFSKKRIDHRHHALDAIIIACTTRNHINYLNNLSALGKDKKEIKEKRRNDLKHSLCIKKYNDDTKQNYKWVFQKPWDTFAQDSKEKLHTTIISFRQNLRIINKTVNQSLQWEKDDKGKMSKVMVPQTIGKNWAIRKPMHKDTVSGLVQLKFKKTVTLSAALDCWDLIVDKPLRQQIKALIAAKFDKKKLLNFFKEKENKWNNRDLSKVEVYYWNKENVASRVNVDDSFNSVKIMSITDSGIQKIMLAHIEKYHEDKNGKIIEHPELAFSPDGLEKLNLNIKALNKGKTHQPIFKVRTFEPKGNKFNVGETGNKKNKFVETAKGTNLFFAIYVDEKGKRNYDTIPFNIVIERQKQFLSPVPETNGLGNTLLFYLSPNDLVYVPTPEEHENENLVNFENLSKESCERIYRMEKASGKECYFIQNNVANLIVQYDAKLKFGEYGSQNKLQVSIDGFKISEFCWKLEISKIGEIKRLVK
jgi:CRISPR-associated endonuclease Csn1